MSPHKRRFVNSSPCRRRELLNILARMPEGNVLADNWFRSVVESLADRADQAKQPLPVAELRKFLDDRSQAPRARWLAYQLLVRVNPEQRETLVEQRLDDPCLPLRREAVRLALVKAEGIEDKTAMIGAYRSALAAAHDVDQIDAIAKVLTEADEKVDLAAVFGFVTRWKLIGPFDNKETKGFEVAYPPELKIELDAELQGSEGKVAWKDHATSDDHGLVDLNEALGRHKGAIAYAYAEFPAEKAQDVELRLGCTNGNKIWLNGELLSSNHVYHSGMFVDQYVGRGRLKKGKNTILLKIAQNEQTEQWAQDWQFQLRVCDPLGAAVAAAKSAQAAATP